MKNLVIKLLNTYFKNFAYFYKHIGYRVVLAIVLNTVVGFLDGIGLTIFFPLLQFKDNNTVLQAESLGKLGFIIDGMNAIGLAPNLQNVLLLLCLFFSFKGISQYLRNAYQVILQQFFIKKIRVTLIKYLDLVGFKYFVTSDAGRIQNTLSGEVEKVARAYQTYFTALQYIILVIIFMSFAFYIDFKFAILVSIGGFLTNIIFNKLYKKTKMASTELTQENHVFQSLIIQRVHNFKYLKATGSQKLFSKKLIQSVDIIEKNNKKIGILASILSAAREPLMIFVVCIVIFIQIIIFKGSLGPILISLLFFYKALNALMFVQTQWNLFLAVSGSLENMTNFTEELKDNNDEKGSINITEFQNSIHLKAMSFGYIEDDYILKDINLEIKKYETIAFVGESGSGKTTLVNVIAGLMKSDKGEILIDSQNINAINVDSYQNRIGYITQDPVIFNDTIFNNITFWAEPNADTIKKFNNAIQKASIADFMENLPLKEQTILGNNGINLSGGQKQRISIARELFKEIDILILDEATSALDSETEKLIQNNIDALKGNYTVLIVAHRLSTIKNANRIVFMNKGKIEMIDNFNDLMQSSASFNRMVKLQGL